MNTTETIESLFKTGVVQINFGKSPDDSWLCEVRQVVDTGEKCQTHLVHQIAAPSVVECLEKSKLQCDHAKIIPLAFKRRN
jgi:hypothetical protein